jgi:hypothetical protein
MSFQLVTGGDPMSKFQIQHLFLILLVLVAGRSVYFGFDWQSGISMLILGGLYTTIDLMLRFFQAKKDVMTENDFRAKIIAEIEALKGQMSGVKLVQMQNTRSNKHPVQF